MEAKHDWARLKTEYITGDYLSLSAFGRAKGFIKNSNEFRRGTKGWKEERNAYWAKIGDDTLKRHAQAQIITLDEAKSQSLKRCLEFGRLITKGVRKALDKTEPNAAEVKAYLEAEKSLQQIIRVHLDADKPRLINDKDKLDALIEGLNGLAK